MSFSVRARAAQALAQVAKDHKSLSLVLPQSASGLTGQDQALLQELCFGVCRFWHRYDYLAGLFLQKPFKAKDSDLKALLYLGFYQLMESRIPDHAALSATVEAARELDKSWAKNLLNGVLRNLQRALPSPPASWQDNSAYRFSHPDWLVKQWRRAWPDHWQAILDANNQHPPLTLRVNVRHGSVETYLARLNEAGITAHATSFSTSGVTLEAAVAVTGLPGFADGAASVQDEAAQLAPQLLELAPGQRVLDACCAPGGKTCHILETEPELAQVLALDMDPRRLTRVEENLERLGLTATLMAADAGDPTRWWDGQYFDRILLDAPCSATGVIRRHPDIKLLRRPDDIAKLTATQMRLLKALWTTLRPGGRLVYATCSVLPAENSEVVEQFIQATPDAIEQVISAQWGIACMRGRQLLPVPGGHDGFYYAVIEKRG